MRNLVMVVGVSVVMSATVTPSRGISKEVSWCNELGDRLQVGASVQLAEDFSCDIPILPKPGRTITISSNCGGEGEYRQKKIVLHHKHHAIIITPRKGELDFNFFWGVFRRCAAKSSALSDLGWKHYQEPTTDMVVSYPSSVFTRNITFPFGIMFHSDDLASISIVAKKNKIPTSARDSLRGSIDHSAPLHYKKVGRNWWVASDFDGDDIYYKKSILSCGGRLESILEIRFPRSLKAKYSPIVEIIENSFRKAEGCSY